MQRARTNLALHDELLATYETSPQRFSDMAHTLNELRGEILNTALSVYFLVGPVYLADDPAALRELLYLADHPLHYQYPAQLEELVTLNIISHLPRSPYPNSVITSEPAEQLPPGTVLYRPVMSHGGYKLRTNGLEFYFLGIVGEEGQGEEPEVVAFGYESYGMDLGGLLPVIPHDLVYHRGFYPGPHSDYRRQLELLD